MRDSQGKSSFNTVCAASCRLHFPATDTSEALIYVNSARMFSTFTSQSHRRKKERRYLRRETLILLFDISGFFSLFVTGSEGLSDVALSRLTDLDELYRSSDSSRARCEPSRLFLEVQIRIVVIGRISPAPGLQLLQRHLQRRWVHQRRRSSSHR